MLVRDGRELRGRPAEKPSISESTISQDFAKAKKSEGNCAMKCEAALKKQMLTLIPRRLAWCEEDCAHLTEKGHYEDRDADHWRNFTNCIVVLLRVGDGRDVGGE
jgi:hypothetical protein